MTTDDKYYKMFNGEGRIVIFCLDTPGELTFWMDDGDGWMLAGDYHIARLGNKKYPEYEEISLEEVILEIL